MPPTVSVPPPVELNEDELAGLLVKEPSVMVLEPPCRVKVAVVGNVTVYAKFGCPIKLKLAAAAGKFEDINRMIDPVALRAPAAETVAVPPITPGIIAPK